MAFGSEPSGAESNEKPLLQEMEEIFPRLAEKDQNYLFNIACLIGGDAPKASKGLPQALHDLREAFKQPAKPSAFEGMMMILPHLFGGDQRDLLEQAKKRDPERPPEPVKSADTSEAPAVPETPRQQEMRELYSRLTQKQQDYLFNMAFLMGNSAPKATKDLAKTLDELRKAFKETPEPSPLEGMITLLPHLLAGDQRLLIQMAKQENEKNKPKDTKSNPDVVSEKPWETAVISTTIVDVRKEVSEDLKPVVKLQKAS